MIATRFSGLADADAFEDLPGKWQAAIVRAEQNRPGPACESSAANGHVLAAAYRCDTRWPKAGRGKSRTLRPAAYAVRERVALPIDIAYSRSPTAAREPSGCRLHVASARGA